MMGRLGTLGVRRRPVPPPARPRHLGIIMDGNRRWARAAGHPDVSAGHRAGAEHLADLLDWCHVRGIAHLSVYVLSADNVRRRSSNELVYLFSLMETVLPQRVRQSQHWSLHISGDLGLLPAPARSALHQAVRDTADRPCHLTLAIGYDPRQDIVAGIRGALGTSSGTDWPDLVAAITDNLPGGPDKEIDLVIRSSGERRLSGFFPWQAQRAEIVVNDKMWPAFGEDDLDAALRDYARRKRS